jgi:hypothetical protein
LSRDLRRFTREDYLVPTAELATLATGQRTGTVPGLTAEAAHDVLQLLKLKRSGASCQLGRTYGAGRAAEWRIRSLANSAPGERPPPHMSHPRKPVSAMPSTKNR